MFENCFRLYHTALYLSLCTIVFLLITLNASGSVSVVRAQTTPIPTVQAQGDSLRADLTRSELLRLEERINNSQANFDRYLTLVELVSGILGLLALIAGVFGVVSINQQRSEFKQQIEAQRETTKKDQEDNRRQQRELEALQATIRLEQAGIEKAREDIRETAQTVNSLNQSYRNIAQAQSLSLLGLQQIQLGNLVTAEETLESAAQVDPDNPVIQYFLGEVMIRQNKIDEAREHLKRAMEARTLPQANVTYAYATRLQGDKMVKLDHFGKPLLDENGKPIEDHEGKEAKYAEAAKIYLDEYKEHPELVDIYGESAYGALAGLYRRQGRLDEAIYYYQHALRVTPNATYPINNLAILNFLRGDLAAGRRYFAQSLELAKAKLIVAPRDYWTWFDMVTAELVIHGTSDEEIDAHLRKAVELAPKREPLRKFLLGLRELAGAPGNKLKFEGEIEYVQRELDRRENLKAIEDRQRMTGQFAAVQADGSQNGSASTAP